ncbi:MAG: DUF488 domain-containing protein [Elusimicrobiota bacterium]
MAVRVVRLGGPRAPGEGPRLGTVRRPPRGVRKEDYARRNFYDVWLPELSPSAELLRGALSEPWTGPRWEKFARAYRREMRAAGPRRLVEILAALSRGANFSVGCYCEREDRCHRSVLRRLLADAGARMGSARRL